MLIIFKLVIKLKVIDDILVDGMRRRKWNWLRHRLILNLRVIHLH